MEPNSVLPTNSSPFNSMPTRSSGPGPIMLILVVLLGIGTLAFGISTLTFYNQAATVKKTANAQLVAAVAEAKKTQKEADDQAYQNAANSPYRSYNAPTAYGSFEIKFPKTWSSFVSENTSGTQVNLLINPDFVRRTNSNEDPVATKVLLVDQNSTRYMSSFSAQIKQKKVKQTEITVSGLKAFDLTGAFTDKKVARMVIVPVRDKVVVFINENNRYTAEFNEILAQAKIVP
jgi:hypothetical protein